METRASAVTRVTEAYYDSGEADAFYFHVWGGEDIHIGIYDPDSSSIADASARTVETMLGRLALGPSSRVIDLGAGYGGAARRLAERTGCSVTCVNLSEAQNRRNRAVCEERGLGARVTVLHADFAKVPAPDHGFDLVWSQDAILHSGDRRAVLAEIRRLMAPGGELVFTDPMQADNCPAGALQPVLDRIHLDSLASPGWYRATLGELGLRELAWIDLTPHLITHYTRVRGELTRRYDDMVALSGAAYVDRMMVGLGHWIEAGQRDLLRWGIFHFRAG
jgi:sarcosine/dimethylglycine N-methyltransferase